MSMLLSFCLSQFASYMVADEENRGSRFQGLRIKIQMFLIPQQLKTYSQVLIIARKVEWGLEKKRQDEMQRNFSEETILVERRCRLNQTPGYPASRAITPTSPSANEMWLLSEARTLQV